MSTPSIAPAFGDGCDNTLDYANVMDSFLISKIIASWLMPLPLISLALLFGLLLLLFSNRKKFATTLIAIATLSLIILSLQPVTESLIRPLEWQHIPLDINGKQLDTIAILGCGHVNNDRLPAVMTLHECSLKRVVEGLRLFQENPQATVIFSGYNGLANESNASVAAAAAISLGLPAANAVILEEPKDTREESLALAKIVDKTTTLAIVTSASHMPRALRYFYNAGLSPLAAPADYHSASGHTEINLFTLSPNGGSLDTARRIWYEWLATIKQKLSR